MKSRSYSVTVQGGHLTAPEPPSSPDIDESQPTESILITGYRQWLGHCGKLVEDNMIDYAVISLEVNKTGLRHLQGFVVFNEQALQEGKPTDYLPGHWLKARNLSGTRDYCARAGIHISKDGVYDVLEYGVWVDPGWNQTLRSRLIYEFATLLKLGWSVVDLVHRNPAGVLMVGEKNLTDLNIQLGRKPLRAGEQGHAAYCYIGRTLMLSALEERAGSSRWFDVDEEE